MSMKFTKKVCVLSNGCLDNRIDSARIVEFLKQNGYLVTDLVREADVILFNACGLTGHQEDVARRMIREIERLKKSGAELILGGCLTKIAGEFWQGATFGVDDDLAILDHVFKARVLIQDVHANRPVRKIYSCRDLSCKKSLLMKAISPEIVLRKLSNYVRLPRSLECESLFLSRLARLRKKSMFRKFPVAVPRWCVKVSTGCLNACSFCAVRLSRGKLRSKPVDTVLQEFEEGRQAGFSQFLLTGTDIGAYGRDQDTSLVVLLTELVRMSGEYRLDLRNLQPRFLIEMLPKLQEALRSGKICRIISAAQSGNDRILRVMNRGYVLKDLKDVFNRLKGEFPEICLHTQVIVGFPGESEEEFQDTVRLLNEVEFDLVEVYPYRPRSGTKAAEIHEQIPEEVIKKRFLSLVKQCDQAVGFPLW